MWHGAFGAWAATVNENVKKFEKVYENVLNIQRKNVGITFCEFF